MVYMIALKTKDQGLFIGTNDNGKYKSQCSGDKSYTSSRIFSVDDFVFGVLNDYKITDFIKYNFSLPLKYVGQSDDEYIYSSFVNGLREELYSKYKITDNDNNATILIGYKDRIFILYPDSTFLELEDEFIILNSEGEPDKDVINFMNSSSELDPTERIEKSLDKINNKNSFNISYFRDLNTNKKSKNVYIINFTSDINVCDHCGGLLINSDEIMLNDEISNDENLDLSD